MATFSAHLGVIKIGTDTIAEITSITVDETADTIEDTELIDTDKSFISGQRGWTASCEAHFDPTDTAGQGAMVNGALVNVVIFPVGESTGDISLTGNAIVNSLSRANASGATVSASFGLQGTGALVEATLP